MEGLEASRKETRRQAVDRLWKGWKQVGKTVRETGRREALKAIEELEASQKDSEEDRP